MNSTPLPSREVLPLGRCAAWPFANLGRWLLAAMLGLGAGAGLRAEPTLLVDPAGRAYFASQDGVFRINSGSDRVEKLPIGPNTTRLLFDADGNLCGLHMRYDTGADLWRPAVWRFQRDETGLIPDKEAADNFAFAEVMDQDGRLYFRDFDPVNGISRLLVREKGAEVALLAGGRLGARDGRGAAARLGRIGAMFAASDRSLYFTDGNSVRKVDREGQVTTLAQGGLLAGADSPDANPLSAIAVDASRNVYVADDQHRRVLCIDAAGTVSRLADYDPYWTIAGLAIDRDGVFALEKGSADTRVRRWSASQPAGTLLVFSADGALVTRARSESLEQRSIFDSPLFHSLTPLAAVRKQLPDPHQPR